MDTYEFAVIQDLQVSLARAYDDKQALRQLIDGFTQKLANAESIIKAANSYCQALENEDENPNAILGVLHQAVYHWNTATK
jgi:hypothetical protein